MPDIDEIISQIRQANADPGQNGETCCDACSNLIAAVKELAIYVKRLAEQKSA